MNALDLLQFGGLCLMWVAIMAVAFLLIGIPVCFVWAKFIQYMDREDLL